MAPSPKIWGIFRIATQLLTAPNPPKMPQIYVCCCVQLHVLHTCSNVVLLQHLQDLRGAGLSRRNFAANFQNARRNIF